MRTFQSLWPPKICLLLGFTWVGGIQTQVPTLASQVLSPWVHLFNPRASLPSEAMRAQCVRSLRARWWLYQLGAGCHVGSEQGTGTVPLHGSLFRFVSFNLGFYSSSRVWCVLGVCGHVCNGMQVCGGRRITWWSQFSPYILTWIPELGLGPSGLGGKYLTCWAPRL